MDLYEVLGLARSATLDDIKKAYKKAARRTHPDVGGSEEAFRAVEDAHRVLSDPDERAFYDATGAIKPPPPPDLEKERLLSMLTMAMNVAVCMIKNPEVDNLIEIMKTNMAESRAAAKKDIVSMGELKLKLARMRKRVKAKTEDNVIAALLQSQIDRMDLQIASAREAIAMFDKGAKFLDDYEYEVLLMLPSRELLEALRRQDSGAYDDFFKFNIANQFGSR